jgi:hypothetical protein
MLKKETAYRIFKLIWLYLLVSTIADLRLHTDIDILPFIHLSEIPFIKYAPFLVVVFLLIPLKEIRNAVNRKHIRTIIILSALLVLTTLVSSFYADYPETALRTTSRFFFYFVLLNAAITAVYYFEEASGFMIRSFIYINVIVISGSLLDYFVPSFHTLLVDHFDRPGAEHSVLKIGEMQFMRPMGFLTDTNLTAFSLSLAMILLLLNHKHFNRVFTYIFFAAASYVSGMLASRASLIMCLVAAVIFLVTRAVEWKQILVFIFIFIVFQAITPQTYSRLLTFSDTEKVDEELKFGRFVIWEAAFDLFKDNPVIGAGPGNFFEHSQHRIRQVIFRDNPDINIDNPGSKDYFVVGKGNPHNLFLAVLCEEGILGFLIFITLIVYLMYRFIKGKQYLSVLFMLLILMVSLVSNFAPYYRFYLLICIIFLAISGTNMKMTSKSADILRQ